MSTEIGTEFQSQLRNIVIDRRMHAVLETGTHRGLGSTRILADALHQVSLDADLVTIEVNTEYLTEAKKNLCDRSNIDFRLGLSVPRGMMPSAPEIAYFIRRMSMENPMIAIDYGGDPMGYFSEVASGNHLQDDLLGLLVPVVKFDMILLDSAGHMGLIEFERLMAVLTYPVILALDDTKHLKHWKTMERIRTDDRFKVLAESDERHGSAIMQFTPRSF